MSDVPQRFEPVARAEIARWLDDHEVPPAFRGDDRFPWSLYGALLANRDFTDAYFAFAGDYLNGKARIGKRQRELIILRVGTLMHASYERAHHVPIAESVGLTDEEIARVASGPAADGWTKEDEVVLRATDELVNDQRITDETWSGLADTYDHTLILELIALVGCYVMTAMVLKTLDVPLEPGSTQI